jgi:hypothetical protein
MLRRFFGPGDETKKSVDQFHDSIKGLGESSDNAASGVNRLKSSIENLGNVKPEKSSFNVLPLPKGGGTSTQVVQLVIDRLVLGEAVLHHVTDQAASGIEGSRYYDSTYGTAMPSDFVMT